MGFGRPGGAGRCLALGLWRTVELLAGLGLRETETHQAVESWAKGLPS